MEMLRKGVLGWGLAVGIFWVYDTCREDNDQVLRVIPSQLKKGTNLNDLPLQSFSRLFQSSAWIGLTGRPN